MPLPKRVPVYLAEVDRAIIIDALEAFANNHARNQSEINRAEVMAQELANPPHTADAGWCGPKGDLVHSYERIDDRRLYCRQCGKTVNIGNPKP